MSNNSNGTEDNLGRAELHAQGNQANISDEEVWAVVVSMPIDGIPPDQFETLRQGLADNPNKVNSLAARACKAINPEAYLAAALREKAQEGWGTGEKMKPPAEFPGLRLEKRLAANERPDWNDDDGSLPAEENFRRTKVLMKAFEAGGFTDELLQELYRDDPEGLAAHYEFSKEESGLSEHGRQWRKRCIRDGADPRKFWEGPTVEERELYEMLRPKKTDEPDAAS